MGSSCSSAPSEGELVRHQEVSPLLEETSTRAKASAMDQGQEKTDFNYFLEANNSMVKLAKEKFDHVDQLRKEHRELKRLNEEIMTENASLRQRYVIECYKINFRNQK